MKLLLVLAAVICAASAASVGNGRTVVLKNAIQGEIMRRLAVKGILPELPDPLILNATTINFDELGTSLANGIVEIFRGVVTGLATVTDELKFNLLLLTLDGDVAIGKAAIEADVSANAVIHLPITGEDRTLEAEVGSSIQASIETFSITALHAKIHVNIATDRGSVSDVDGTLHFDGVINVNGVGIKWDGVLVDWAAVNADLPAFIADLIANHRAELLEIVTDVINIVLADISISEIIGAIGK